jgi:hypothetical protein
MIINCPKCDADITDTYEPTDDDVGIVGGWYCDACDLGIAEWEIAISKNLMIDFVRYKHTSARKSESF